MHLRYLREACYLLEEGALPREVDAPLRAFGLAMGPFQVCTHHVHGHVPCDRCILWMHHASCAALVSRAFGLATPPRRRPPLQMSDLAGNDIGYNVRKDNGWSEACLPAGCAPEPITLID